MKIPSHKTHRMRMSILLLTFLIIALSCSTKDGKNDSADNADSLRVVPKADSSASNNNTEKGIKEHLIDTKAIDPAISRFVSSLSRMELVNVIDKKDPFVIVSPGVGAQPSYTFGQSLEDLLGLSEILLLLSDSSALVATTYYDFAKSKCAVLEESPEGIYIKEFAFADKMDALQSNSDDESLNNKIKAKLNSLKGEKGVEILIKFSDKNLNTLFIDFYTFKRDGALIVAFVDQQNCGA